MFYTERFHVKKLDESNANSHYLSWFQDDDIKKFILNHPSSISDLALFINTCNTNDCIMLFGVFSKNNQQHIGNIKFEFDEKIPLQVTMGVMIGDPQWRGKGVASEVILESGSFLSKQFNIKNMLLGVDKDNFLAIKAYKKIGFKQYENNVDESPFLSMIWCLSGG